MESFGIETGGASEFIMLNSAARYVSIAIGMILGIWIFRTFHSILLALLIRLSMDILDLYAGIQAEIITNFSGVLQSMFMFLIPGILSILLLLKQARNP